MKVLIFVFSIIFALCGAQFPNWCSTKQNQTSLEVFPQKDPFDTFKIEISEVFQGFNLSYSMDRQIEGIVLESNSKLYASCS